MESYKTTFEFSKKTDTELMSMLKNKNNSINENSKHDEIAPIIKGGCEENIDKKVGIPDQEEILKKIKKGCVAKPSTIEGMLKSTILSSGGDGKYKKMQSQTKVFNDIRSTEFTYNDRGDRVKGGLALEKGCRTKIKNKTYEVGASDLLKKVEDRCTATQN